MNFDVDVEDTLALSDNDADDEGDIDRDKEDNPALRVTVAILL